MKFQKIICENKQFNSKKIDGKELLPSIFFLKPIEFCYHLIYNVYRNNRKSRYFHEKSLSIVSSYFFYYHL